MKKIFILPVCLLVSIIVNAQSIQWQKLLGGANDDNLSSYNIQQTTDGGYITAGTSNSSNTGTLTGVTNNGGSDGWIVKTDASGTTQWQKLLGGSNDDLLYSIQQTTDGGYIVCGYSNSSNSGTLSGINNYGANDGWIIKLDALGNTVWQKLFGGSNNDYLFWIRQTADGGYIAAGQSFSSNDGTLTGVVNHGSLDGWIIKLDATGSVIQFQQLLGGNDDDFFRGIEQTADLGYIVTCAANSFNTGTLTGVPGATAAGSAWVVKLDASGATTWQKLFGGSGIDAFISIQQTIDGGYIAVGYSNSPSDGSLTGVASNGNLDGWVMKMNASGNTTWQKLLGGSNDDLLVSIQQSTDGGYIAAGYALSSNTGTLTGITNHGGNDGYLIKLNSAGDTQSQQLLGGNVDDKFQSVRQTSDGGYIIAAISQSSNTGDLTGITNNGGIDGWLVKLTQFSLPVTLGDFTATKINESEVKLDWFTLTEANNSGFDVEKSLNNSSSFSSIAFINSKIINGNSNQKLNYTFVDKSNKNGINYYRLKQVDKDGKYKFSNILKVDFSIKQLISISPNPAHDYIFINTPDLINEVRLISQQGTLLNKWGAVISTTRLNISNIPAGTYILQLITAREVRSQQIVKE